MTHLCGVVQDFEGHWHAECSCGWVGPVRGEIMEAATDAKEHKAREAAEQETGP